MDTIVVVEYMSVVTLHPHCEFPSHLSNVLVLFSLVVVSVSITRCLVSVVLRGLFLLPFTSRTGHLHFFIFIFRDLLLRYSICFCFTF